MAAAVLYCILGSIATFPIICAAEEKPLVALPPCSRDSTSGGAINCTNPALGRLDSGIAAAYKQATARLHGDLSLSKALQDKQTALIADRANALAAGEGSLLRYLQTWLNWLDAVDSPRQGFAGTWISATGSLQVLPRGEGTYTVLAHADEPIRGEFTCNFIGVGRVNRDILDVAWDISSSDGDDAEGWTLRLRRSGHVLRLEQLRNASEASTSPFCGVLGSLEDTYLPARSKPEPVQAWKAVETEPKDLTSGGTASGRE